MFYQNKNEASKVFGKGFDDIEDIGKRGQSNIICPYYALRELISKAHIIFMPYNYMINEFMRRTLKINLNNCVIVFDEAHNVPKSAEEVSSFKITLMMLNETLMLLN
jgi:Rad3-related DNA helicase